MRGYACANCGAEFDEKLKPPTMAKRFCRVCNKPLVVKMNDRKTEVTTYFEPPPKSNTPKRKKVLPHGGIDTS